MKNWSVKVQVNSKNEFVQVEVQAESFKQAWARAQEKQSGVVCAINAGEDYDKAYRAVVAGKFEVN